MADCTVQVRMNGPLRVTGPFNLTDQEDREFTIPEGQAVALCRCGRSENKPFCDSPPSDRGAHVRRPYYCRVKQSRYF